MQTYFATDGSYGDGEDIEVIDTVYWTDEQWAVIDGCGDRERIKYARAFARGFSIDEATSLIPTGKFDYQL